MQKKSIKVAGGKKEDDFEKAFAKASGKLSTGYKDQFKKVEYAGAKTKQARIEQAKKTGKELEVVKKSTGNKTEVNIGKLLEEDVDIKTNPKELGSQVSKKRNEKLLTQDKLAIMINEPSSVIKDIENGTGKYSSSIVSKLEKAMDFKIDRSWKK